MSETKTLWSDYVARCETKPVLAKKLYVVLAKPASDFEAVREAMPAHLAFQSELEQKGIMFAAGPFASDDEKFWEGEGMSIIRANSVEEASEIAKRDPMIVCGAKTCRVRPWLVNEGGFTLKLRFSGDELGFEMV